MFIGVLGRVDYNGHFTPMTQAIRLTRGVCHGKFDVKDCGNVPKVTSRYSEGDTSLESSLITGGIRDDSRLM